MNRLKELREESSLTQQELADKIGISKRTLGYWEKEEVQIKSDKAKQLADYFNVSVPYLLGFSDFKDEQKSALEVYKTKDGFEVVKSRVAELIGEKRLKIIEENYTTYKRDEPDFDKYIDLMCAIGNISYMDNEERLLVNFALLPDDDKEIIVDLTENLANKIIAIRDDIESKNLPF
ncbi:helix-turn-helix domain-containing protein [Streptococcus parauberis]|uniref:helix-turn-helix domain-containing protein n=1 Tax=Streptococcus parauberis TaxID=1348 RepID=UPI00020CBC3B|nr:helix-turn-helix transcriptional regulator [Streptococcus parauberis]AEF25795.1 DNA-binding phage protein [Streptococcus parauberis KCTC 11537]QBX09769.1 helix-turn-helix domain protein [Streptococcus satellite phage Javan387]QBX10001.1 helix-turn-helix domain protein [Streptococcus satellite phage Javan403]QBX10078.1 helix-turn-helix domain protein [Streptococcus satellite phage Javan409]OHY29906.1 transcriptional regulator [Streptococcus parauberis]